MRRLPRATRITIVITGILAMLNVVMGNIGATAFPWLSPWIALALFVLISLILIGFSLWLERQKSGSEPSTADACENRQIMLGRVQNKWITGFLENPLYHSYDEQLLSLPLHERVGSLFDRELTNPLEPTQIIPSGTTLAQVFDQAGGELLILGEPGAGKTTLLLELARDLLKRAKDDKDNPIAPIPVVLTLSSWATRKLPLEQWIAEELNAKYDVPTQIGKEWVKANQLLLLLDGLDEVAPGALPACIDAINTYYHQAHRSLVVCSRTKEFLDQPGRLALHTAVIVQPLSPEQVDTYLDGLAAKGEDVEGLKHTLHQSTALNALATTPLFLTVLLLAYHGKSVQELLPLVKAVPTDQQPLIFHNYVERVLQRKGTRIHACAQQTKHWLTWLALQMSVHHQSELYLEQFQPDWLPQRRRAVYRWSIRLVFGLLLGLLSGLAFGLVGGLYFGLYFGLVVGVCGLVGGLHIGRLGGLISETEILPWSWANLRGRLVSWLVFGLISGLAFGLLGGLAFGLAFGLFSGLYFGLIFGLAFGLISEPEIEIRPVEILSRSWVDLWVDLGNKLKVRLAFGLIFCLILGLVVGLHVGLLSGLVGGLAFGLSFEFGVLSLVLSQLQVSKRLMLTPNEGIRRSLKNGLFFGLLFGLLGGLFGRLVVGLLGGLLGRQDFGLLFGLLFGLVGGLAFGLANGLNAVVQHYILRFCLWQARSTPAPWRYIAFLDDAAEHLLLRKVGGGYIFRHDLLQDYFADLDLDPNNPLAYETRGDTYYELKEYKRAIRNYSRAIELDPNTAGYYRRRGKAYAMLKQFDYALADYNRVIELDPNHALDYINRGNAYAEPNQSDPALTDFSRAIELDPNNPLAYQMRGHLYSYLKEYKQAASDYSRAIELDPNYAEEYGWRAKAYYELKEYQSAIEDYTRAIELDPSNALDYINRGSIYFYLKEYEQAASDFSQALDLDPNNALTYNDRGSTYFYLKEYEQAASDFSRAIELDPNNALTYNDRGFTYSYLKEYEQALADLNHAIDLDPTSGEAYINRGWVYLWQRNIMQARDDFARAVEIDPTNPLAALLAEWSSLSKQPGGIDIAERFEEIASSKPQESQKYIALVCQAIALGLRNKPEEGLEELDKAITLMPEKAIPFFWKGILSAYQTTPSDAKDAIESIQQALVFGLPPILLNPLHWLEYKRLKWFSQYARPLLDQHGIE